jgi:hypothetical protein
LVGVEVQLGTVLPVGDQLLIDFRYLHGLLQPVGSPFGQGAYQAVKKPV